MAPPTRTKATVGCSNPFRLLLQTPLWWSALLSCFLLHNWHFPPPAVVLITVPSVAYHEPHACCLLHARCVVCYAPCVFSGMLWYCLGSRGKACKYLVAGIQVVFVLLRRRILDRKPGICPHEATRALGSVSFVP